MLHFSLFTHNVWHILEFGIERKTQNIVIFLLSYSPQVENGLVIVWKCTIAAHSVKVTALYAIHEDYAAAEDSRRQHCEVLTSPSPPEIFRSTFGIQIYAFEVCPFTNGTCPDSFYCSSTAPLLISLQTCQLLLSR